MLLIIKQIVIALAIAIPCAITIPSIITIAIPCATTILSIITIGIPCAHTSEGKEETDKR